ncbi:cysteine/Histidine-rich C1 domain family protein [Artemisia annua]|uniref:Cysteine/Histidine-rich C1 domain family protein n=1 Tax=Artemisia annua TaxID=35608 RepID=A0A2U1LUH2_ARTAN|nr:cysteine/Histidine-rich C1 domain family protein [Artemisia annua]
MDYKHFSQSHNLHIHRVHELGQQVNYSGWDTPCDNTKAPVHVCDQCHFFLHDHCANARHYIKHPAHESQPINLLPYPTYASNTFFCNACVYPESLSLTVVHSTSSTSATAAPLSSISHVEDEVLPIAAVQHPEVHPNSSDHAIKIGLQPVSSGTCSDSEKTKRGGSNNAHEALWSRWRDVNAVMAFSYSPAQNFCAALLWALIH